MENHKETLNHYLAELGGRAGVPGLALDEKACCWLKYGEGVDFCVQLPGFGETLLLSSPLLFLPQKEREAFFLKLLELNLYNQETHGATLAVDSRESKVVLCYTHVLAQLDATAFINVVGCFLETVMQMKEKLGTFKEEEGDDGGETILPLDPETIFPRV